jgi:2-C-methyl-D-erythritol 4-phosphate cytidylyltransferase
VTAGGETRADSVRRGLAKVPDNVEIIVVHDAVRPLASVSLFKLVIEAVERGADGAIPGLAVTDTIKHQANNKVISTINREELVVSQTPQAFNASILRLAHQNQPEATDDASLVENCGGTVVVVPGEAKNIKITAPSDLKIAELLLGESEDGLE